MPEAPTPTLKRSPALPAFTPVLPPVDAQQRRALRVAQGLEREPTANQPKPDVWARASALGRGAARLTVSANGLVPCALTTASTALAVQPWVATAVAWSQRTNFFRFAAPLLGPAAGAAAVVTGLVLATATLAVAQLARQRFGASSWGAAALLATHAFQAALGLALAPCLVSSLTLFGPAGGVVLAATVGLTLVLGFKRAAGQASSPMGASALVGACLLVGPIGWSVACGMVPHVAVAQSVALYGMWLFATAASGVVVHKLLHAVPTPDFEEGVIAPTELGGSRFERPDASVAATAAEPPTIFDVDESLWELLGRLRPELPKDPTAPFLGFRGQPVRHFHGPAGGGKTRSTLGLARELGAYYRASDANELESDRLGDLPVAAIKACLLLLSADAYGRKMGRPVLLLLDEVDAMLPSPDGAQDQERINRALGFVLFVHLLRLLQRNGSYVVLITATNRYEAYEPMLRLLGQNGGAFLGAPSRESKRKVLTAGLRQMSLSLRRRVPWAPMFDERTEEVDALLRRCEELGAGALSLRSMANLARVGFEAGCGEAARQGARGVRQGEAVRELVRYAFASMHAELAAGDEGREDEGPKDAAPADDKAKDGAQRSRRASAQAQVNLDRLLQQTGLRDTSTMQVFQSLVENVGREYPKPENAIAFARLELRLANLFALTMLQLGRSASVETQAPLHHQVYVPDARPLDWLPSPTGVLASAFRAARSRLRATAVLRRGRASR